MSEKFMPALSLAPRPWDCEALKSLQSELKASRRDFLSILDAEEDHPAFDPIAVRNLLRKEHALGREPEILILGKIEMASFHHFICRGYGEESGAPMKELFFLGVPVIEDSVASRLEFSENSPFSTNGPQGNKAA